MFFKFLYLVWVGKPKDMKDLTFIISRSVQVETPSQKTPLGLQNRQRSSAQVNGKINKEISLGFQKVWEFVCLGVRHKQTFSCVEIHQKSIFCRPPTSIKTFHRPNPCKETSSPPPQGEPRTPLPPPSDVIFHGFYF